MAPPLMSRHVPFVELLLLASLAGCGGDSPLPGEPDPCPANLALMVGQWTGMAGDVRVTMALAPKKVESSLFGLPITEDVMSGPGMADHPDDSLDIPVSFQFMCVLGLDSWVDATIPPSEDGAPPTSQRYTVGRLYVQDVTSTRIVGLLTPIQAPMNRPNPFAAQVQIEFVRPPA